MIGRICGFLTNIRTTGVVNTSLWVNDVVVQWAPEREGEKPKGHLSAPWVAKKRRKNERKRLLLN